MLDQALESGRGTRLFNVMEFYDDQLNLFSIAKQTTVIDIASNGCGNFPFHLKLHSVFASSQQLNQLKKVFKILNSAASQTISCNPRASFHLLRTLLRYCGDGLGLSESKFDSF